MTPPLQPCGHPVVPSTAAGHERSVALEEAMANAPRANGPDPDDEAPRGVGRGAQAPSEEAEIVSVRFPDFQTARRAIEHMERDGLDGAKMAFDRASLERAFQSAESGARDDRFLQRAIRNLGRGALIGLGVGLVVGVGIGVAVLGPTVAIIGATVAVTAAGGLVGAALGGIWGHEQSPAWEDTFEAPDAGEAVLHIELHRPEEVNIVRDTARHHDAVLQ